MPKQNFIIVFVFIEKYLQNHFMLSLLIQNSKDSTAETEYWADFFNRDHRRIFFILSLCHRSDADHLFTTENLLYAVVLLSQEVCVCV